MNLNLKEKHQLPAVVIWAIVSMQKIAVKYKHMCFSNNLIIFVNVIAPDAPVNLTILDDGKNETTLQWGIPWILNGELKSFLINGKQINYLFEPCCETIEQEEIPIDTILQPTYNYTVKVLIYILLSIQSTVRRDNVFEHTFLGYFECILS